MSYRWDGNTYGSFVEMRNAVVYQWLSDNQGVKLLRTILSDNADYELIEAMFGEHKSRQLMFSASLSRQDAEEGLAAIRREYQ